MAPTMGNSPDNVPDTLERHRDKASEDLQHYFLQFEDLWERKLWHELTELLVEFYKRRDTAQHRLDLYASFVWTFADKINQLKLVELALASAPDLKDDKERLDFYTKVIDKVNKPASQDAYVYLTTAYAEAQLRLEDYDGARKKLDECEGILDSFDSVETVVHAAFYRTNADYYKAKADFSDYYRSSLLYLACIDLSTLPPEQLRSRAYDLSLAALVSDSIYNFGELLLHPILNSLTNTEHSWLRDLLFAFNKGDLRAYSVLQSNISKIPLLNAHQNFLYQKISLAALTETVFKRPPHDRALTFAALSHETSVQPNEIEHLIMKALSLGLVRGTIDQVAEVARINWVQPKVLDMSQIEGMRSRLREWDGSVNLLGNWIEERGRDVWAA